MQRVSATDFGPACIALSDTKGIDPAEIIKAVQNEVFPLDINYFRTHSALSASLKRLDALWENVGRATALNEDHSLKLRQAQAMLATARFMYRAALSRTETRGMHRREDYPTQNPAQHHRLILSGLDHIAVRHEAVDPGVYKQAAE
ncbi:FAD-binding protein [Ensifer sp. Root558]|uniref:FAD-binding protein n=1 Tax=Ensifer sp. Root558 TaxID=1736558 RepID=UPI001FCDB2DB|nr:FAD-binding protein [Ensifer sp. Root558]